MFLLMNANIHWKGTLCRKGALVVAADVADCGADWSQDSRAEAVGREEGEKMIANGVKLIKFPHSKDIEIPVADVAPERTPYHLMLANNIVNLTDLLDGVDSMEFLGSLRDAAAEGMDRH